jgi:methyl-accepting chemotaxis protein
MLQGVSFLSSLVDEAATISARQARSMQDLADAMGRMQDISAESSTESSAAAQAAAAQTAGADTLSATARDLAALAERMRAAVARFTAVG